MIYEMSSQQCQGGAKTKSQGANELGEQLTSLMRHSNCSPGWSC